MKMFRFETLNYLNANSYINEQLYKKTLDAVKARTRILSDDKIKEIPSKLYFNKVKQFPLNY